MLSVSRILTVIPALLVVPAYGFSPSSIIRSSCVPTINAPINFHVGITASSISSSTLFSTDESPERYDSEFNLDDDDGAATASNIPRQPSAATTRKKLDPLIASLTRIDEPTPANVPMRSVPLFGDVPADGNLALLIPAAGIAILGFIFSIVVAFNARDELVSEFNNVKIPKMEYTPTVVEEGKCRGLCSSQEDDVDSLRNFMESISKKSSNY
ncbi:hypothetical protein ACHAXM_009726 [Skeletonema potamos]|jgi:hypothetical protein